MATTEFLLTIERELKSRDDKRFKKFETLKNELLANEYIFVLHRFPGGNDHGPEHIKRVLEYLDKLTRDRLAQMTTMEIYFLLSAAVLHDQGMLQGRQDHQRTSQRFLKSHDYRFFFEPPEVDVIGRMVRLHSSSERIEKEFPENERFLGGEKIRPRHLAAILRLADELDEDFRRSKVRIFDNMIIPDESKIYWLRNFAIESVEPLCAEGKILVTASFGEHDLDELFPLDDGLANIPTAVFRKVQKMNTERRYCSAFFEDDLKLRSIEFTVRLRDTNRRVNCVVDDHDEGAEFEAKHPDLFRSRKNETTRKPQTSPVRPTVTRIWSELSQKEKESLPPVVQLFAKDAEEIVANPHLHGLWRLEVGNADHDLSVTLSTRIFLPDYDSEFRVEVFPVGHYPLKAPGISVVPADAKLDERVRSALGSVLIPQVWNSKYRPLESHRLIHLADGVAQLQERAKLFRALAAPPVSGPEAPWELVLSSARPFLKRRFSSNGTKHELTVEQSANFPTEIPSIRCSPAPATRHWLGTGEINKEVFGRVQWREALRQPNPLAELTRALDGIIGA